MINNSNNNKDLIFEVIPVVVGLPLTLSGLGVFMLTDSFVWVWICLTGLTIGAATRVYQINNKKD